MLDTMPTEQSHVPPLPPLPAPPLPSAPVEGCSTAVTVTPRTDSVGTMHLHAPARLPNESPDAHARFVAWLLPDGGLPRSMARTARELGLSPSTLKEQASRYDWRARAIQHDRRKVELQAAQAGQLAVEAGRDALALCRQLREQLARIVAEAEESDDASTTMQLALDASKVLERLTKTERLILGLSTENQSVHVTDGRKLLPDLRGLTDAELRAREFVEEFSELMDLRMANRLGQQAQRWAELVAKAAA